MGNETSRILSHSRKCLSMVSFYQISYNLPMLSPILIVIALAGVGVLADYFLKLSGNGEKYISYPYFFAGMIIYALTAFG